MTTHQRIALSGMLGMIIAILLAIGDLSPGLLLLWFVTAIFFCMKEGSDK